jgi:hypothetical protein
MDFQRPARPTGRTGGNIRPPPPPIPETSAEESPVEPVEEEQRVAISVSVADGYRFGCGLILAALTAYFALILVVAVAFLVATILGLPLPFGLGGR